MATSHKGQYCVGKVQYSKVKKSRRRWFKTPADAVAHILKLSLTDPDGVCRGDYYIDGPC